MTTTKHRSEKTTPPSRRAILYRQCKEIANRPDILDALRAALHEHGVVGDLKNSVIVFLVLVSRLLAEPASVILKGPTCGGKSKPVDVVLPFVPKSAYVPMTSASNKALFYSSVSYKHRIIIFHEAGGMRDETRELVKVLLTQGYIRRTVTVRKSGGGFETEEIVKEGPTGLVTTTTAVNLDPEIESRVLSLAALDTEEQTNAIIMAKANAAEDGSGEKPPTEVTEWQALQEWLALGPTKVIVPFASSLGTLTRGIALRMRRDFPAVLSFVKAHALLHRRTRDRRDGMIVATIADYRAIWKLIKEVIAAGVDSTVAPEIRETVQAVAKLAARSKPVELSDLVGELGIHRTTAWRRVRDAIKLGYLRDLETRERQACRIVIGNPLPENINILPSPKAVLRHYKSSRKTGTADRLRASARLLRKPQKVDKIDGRGNAKKPSHA
jgi:hypothetical protein